MAYCLHEMETIRRGQPAWDTALIDTWQARLWLVQGNLPAAERWSQACGLDVGDELCFLNEFGHMTLARVRLAQGRAGEARRLLEQLLAAAESAGRLGRAIEILVLQAVTLQADNDAVGALAALKRALFLAEPGGYVRTFVDEGVPLAELLLWGAERRAWPEPRLVAYADRLLAAFGVSEPPRLPGGATAMGDVLPHAHTPTLIEPLTGRELQVLQLVATGVSNQDIARQLVVSRATVKSHLCHIYSKLQVTSRTQAVARARLLRLLP